MKQKIVAIIQGRMSSSRLPGKILADIAGQPMLSRVYVRTARAKMLNLARRLVFNLTLVFLLCGCSFPILIVKSPNSVYKSADVIKKSTNASWREGTISFFSDRPAMYLNKLQDHTGLIFLLNPTSSEMMYLNQKDLVLKHTKCGYMIDGVSKYL